MKPDKDLKQLPAFDAKLKRAGLPSVVADLFRYYYRKVATGETGLIYDHDIEKQEFVKSIEIQGDIHVRRS